MVRAGIRELKQNASAVIAQVRAGDTVIITDHGVPVAQITPLPASPYEQLLASGAIRPATHRLADLPAPEPGEAITPVLLQMRADERY